MLHNEIGAARSANRLNVLSSFKKPDHTVLRALTRIIMDQLKLKDKEDPLNWTRGEFEIPSAKACGSEVGMPWD